MMFYIYPEITHSKIMDIIQLQDFQLYSTTHDTKFYCQDGIYTIMNNTICKSQLEKDKVYIEYSGKIKLFISEYNVKQIPVYSQLPHDYIVQHSTIKKYVSTKYKSFTIVVIYDEDKVLDYYIETMEYKNNYVALLSLLTDI